MNETEITTAFAEKLGSNYAQSIIGWLEMGRSELIAAAPEIAAAKMLISQLPEALTTDQMEYLLQFDNPLEIMRDAWMLEDGVDHSDELCHTVQGVMECNDPEYAPPERGQTMC